MTKQKENAGIKNHQGKFLLLARCDKIHTLIHCSFGRKPVTEIVLSTCTDTHTHTYTQAHTCTHIHTHIKRMKNIKRIQISKCKKVIK